MKYSLTGKTVEEIMEKLPDELAPQQLSALLLTLVDRYAGGRASQAVSLLITSAIVYARTLGSSDNQIAALLESTAAHIRNETDTDPKKVH